MKVIDLFSGCGGMSQGFQNAGYEIVAAFDKWKPAVEIYRKNFPDHPIFENDLGEFDGDALEFSKFKPGMIIGGPPCQDFSSAGKRDESLGRADLTVIFAELVAAVSPRWFVMENVERAADSRAFAKARRIFEAAGYGLTQTILDASLCGVPQYRKRLFLIGEFNGQNGALTPFLARGLAEKPTTVREYMGDKLEIEHYYRHPRSYARRAVFSIDEPSPTVRGVNRPIPPTYRSHPGDTSDISPALRPLTTKERSLIQTFPEDFVFEGSKADLEQMIGNAVPVKLAEHVALRIQEYIKEGPLLISTRENKEAVQLSLI
jgi:DNA (cytosine-5)-methyltransferase 1